MLLIFLYFQQDKGRYPLIEFLFAPVLLNIAAYFFQAVELLF